MRNEYKPNEHTIDKAIELWKGMLKNPKFDNGDQSNVGGLAVAMTVALPKNTTEELLDKFGENLKKALMTKNENGFYDTWLDVDYAPSPILAEAAKKAGLECEFPWKTNMHLREDYLSLSYGHGAESVFYYPLKDGKWLVTKLSGDEIDKVIEYVEGGKPKFLVISKSGK